VPGAWDPFELAVRAILGQQVTVAAATRLAGQIAERWGAAFEDETLSRVFPRPTVLAAAQISGMPQARARAINALAAASHADPNLFARGADLERSIAALKALPGIGEWTAHYIAMRALRESDAFPAADIGLLRAMDDGGGRPDPAQLLAMSAAWRPWRAYAAMHLWARPTAKESSDALAA
jgi:3-methyladenine DNA glycosylase/8-oxoguanine DNA glycosylase